MQCWLQRSALPEPVQIAAGYPPFPSFLSFCHSPFALPKLSLFTVCPGQASLGLGSMLCDNLFWEYGFARPIVKDVG